MSPLFHVDALAIVAGELAFWAGRQLDWFHLVGEHVQDIYNIIWFD